MGDVNWLAAAVSTVVGFFLLGGLWYSKKVLGKAWGRAAGLLDEQGNWKGVAPGESPKPKHAGRVFAMSFLFAIVSAVLFGWLFHGQPTLGHWLCRGAVVGVGFVACSFGINYQFAQKPTVLWLIDGGYHTVQFLLYGLAFGLLR